MTLAEAKQLVDRLTARMAGRPSAISDLDLASEYATACEEANRRLAQCARMVEDGSGLQALLFAEEKPPLMDLLGVLGFAKQREWLDLCEEYSLPLPPQTDRHALNALNDLYASGRKADQTKALYHDFRGAMATKNEARALEVIRAIARLDPADADAARQLVQLERKAQQSAKSNLEKALQAGDENAILRWLDRCEALDVGDCEALQHATMVRKAHAAAAALQEIDRMAAELPKLQERGLWQQCGERATRIRLLAATHAIAISPEITTRVASSLSYFEAQRTSATAEARFQGALKALAEGIEALQALKFASARRSLDQIEADLLSLRKLYEAAKSFDRPIPETLTQPVSQLAASLEAEAGRLRKMRRMRKVAAAIVLVVVVAALGAFGYAAFQANNFASQIHQLRHRDASIALQGLVEKIHSQHPVLLRFPSLATAMTESERWLATIDAKRKAAELSLAEAAEVAKNNFAGLSMEQATVIFRQVTDNLAALPSDMADALEIEFAQAEKKLALWLPEQRNERAANFRRALEEAKPSLAELSLTKSPVQIEEELRKLSPKLEPIQTVLDTQTPDTGLPAALQAEAQAAAEKVKAFEKLLHGHQSALDAVAQAKDIPGFTQALEGLAEIVFPGSPEVQAAQEASLKKLDPGYLLGQLILPASPEAWASVKSANDLASLPFPKTPRDAERDRLAALINDPNMADIHNAKVVPPAAVARQNFESGRQIFSRGKIDRRSTPAGATTWTGTIYDPAKSATAVIFADVNYAYQLSPVSGEGTGEYVSTGALSKVSESLRSMKLGDLVNREGSEYRKSILSIIDNVRQTQDCPPLAKAYILQELARIAKSRPAAWGLEWSPAFTTDMAALDAAARSPLRSQDWMLPSKSPLTGVLDQALNTNSVISYELQAKLHRRLAAGVLETGLQYRGFVDTQGQLILIDAADPSEILWGLSSRSGVLAPLFHRDETGRFSAADRGEAMTPVFSIDNVSDTAVREVMANLGLGEDQIAAYSAQLPQLFKVQSGTASFP